MHCSKCVSFWGTSYSRPPIDPYLTSTLLQNPDGATGEWQWHQLGHMQLCTSLQTDNHASTPPLSFFTGRMPFLPPNQGLLLQLEGYSRPTYNKLVHSATMHFTVVGVIHKLTVDVDNTCTSTTCCDEIF